MNLFTKHLIALDTPHFYEKMIQEKISQLSNHESNGSYSIWHLNQYKDIVIDKAISASCIQCGLTEGSHCSVCEEIIKEQEIVPAKGHSIIVDSAVSATCTKSGLTEGSHCSVCGTVLE